MVRVIPQIAARRGVPGSPLVQLVAGHRIWLVSSQYVKALQGVVPSGSLTGGAVAKVKRFVGHIDDILRSVSESRHHLDEVAGEDAQANPGSRSDDHRHRGRVHRRRGRIGVPRGTPTGVGQAAAMVIQLALGAFGAAGHLGKISPEAARELGRLSRLDQVLLEQLAKRGGAVVEQLGAVLAKVPGCPRTPGSVWWSSRRVTPLKQCGALARSASTPASKAWVLLASRQVKQPSQLLDLEQSLDKAIELGRFHPDVAMEVNHYQGKRVTSDHEAGIRAQVPGQEPERNRGR